MTNPIDIDILRGKAAETPQDRLPAARHQREGHVHDCVVVVLSDDTLLDGLDELRWRLGGMLEPGPSRLVLDLSRVSRLSSTTIATLLWVKRTCRLRAVEFDVRRPSRASIGLLLRTGLLSPRAVDDPRHRVAASLGAGTAGEAPK